MSTLIAETILKGGSLNRTCLRRFQDGTVLVRKSISRQENREYGFVRWYSQFKRMQRYDALFPGLFPRIVDIGTDGECAYLDMEFLSGFVDVKTYLSADRDQAELKRLHTALWSAMDRLHDSVSFPTYGGSLALYYAEEVEQRLADAMQDSAFRDFCQHETIVVNGRSCPSLLQSVDWFKAQFLRHHIDSECYTHGNITLENLLYHADDGRIVFIDPYEENVIDCREAEYSQVLQCCNQVYGYINDRTVDVQGNQVAFTGQIPAGFAQFHDLFQQELARRLSPSRMLVTRLLEASQFTRMLPFKVLAGDLEKAKYFYGVASLLVEDLKAAVTNEGQG